MHTVGDDAKEKQDEEEEDAEGTESMIKNMVKAGMAPESSIITMWTRIRRVNISPASTSAPA